MYYYNSHIQVKRKKCNTCLNPNAVIYSHGKCAYCAKKENAKTKIKLAIEDTELENFFKHAALKIAETPYCSNCYEFIPEKYYRHATAHILPKKLFKSVAAHPQNFLVLGCSCGCHDRSHVWSKFKDMAVWQTAVAKFKILYPLIYHYEHQFLPPELLDTL